MIRLFSIKRLIKRGGVFRTAASGEPSSLNELTPAVQNTGKKTPSSFRNIVYVCPEPVLV
jgi:hypothetical protein